MRTLVVLLGALMLTACNPGKSRHEAASKGTVTLRASINREGDVINVFRNGDDDPVLIQHAQRDFRPYIHPIVAPDGKGVLTENSPDHHKHQTGLYWGFTRVNGRDYFHNPTGDYWKKVSADVMQDSGAVVKWKTVYDLLDENGQPVMRETQNWSMRQSDGKYVLDLEWRGQAQTAVTIGKYDYGGLFLRMPWHDGMPAEVVNAARQRNEKAEGQPAMWLDIGMQVKGRDDLAHVAIFDHPDNRGYPQAWRVDAQMGVGPAPSRAEGWTIAKGETETIRHEIVIYTGKLNDVELTQTWGAFSGQNSTYALWNIAQQEGLQAKFLSPQEAADAMTLVDGYKVNVWASEPMMSQPMAFCWDDRGRMWIAENKDYESRGHGFSNSGDSRILILEDTNRDGVADKRKVFMEGLAFPSALAVGFGGLFVGAPPNLLFIPDKNNDDVADEKDIRVLLTGWGIQDRHETMNSLHWGPDGWLYGLEGFATPSKVRKPNGKGRLYKHNDPFPDDLMKGEGVDINGGVWRYHPTKERFEVVAHGFSNPWGIDYDAKGQLFISACVIPHLWHVIQGGIYHRQGGRHFNPYFYSDIRTIADHSHRSAHGGARVYLSDAFPQAQRGRIFMANIHEHAVLSDVLERSGSGFVGHHGDDFLLANNAQWVGFSMEVGPEGGLYVLDWHDADICGKEVLNGETGRIFRIMPERSLAEQWPGRYDDLEQLTDAKLAELQASPSEWHARRARIILQGRAASRHLDAAAIETLRKMFHSDPNADWQLRAMWTLHITNSFGRGELLEALKSKDEYIRAWAIQLLCEDKAPPAAALSEFERMATADRSPVVRLYLASALQRVNPESAWSIAKALIAHGEDADDHNLPKMIWFGTEPLVAQDPARALGLAAESNIPLIAEYTARRSVDADATQLVIERLATKPKTIASMLRGMRDALESRNDVTTPSDWPGLYATLQKADTTVSHLAGEIAQLFGDTEAARQAINVLNDKQSSADSRTKALQRLAFQQRPELRDELPDLLEEPSLRLEAIRAVAAYDDEELGRLLLKKYPAFDLQARREIILALSSRPRYGRILTQAIKDKSIPRNEVPLFVARQLRRVVGSGFVETWGPIDELPAANNEAYERYVKLLSDDAIAHADARQGKSVFMHTCGACHTMFGEGGKIGPDLTGSNRANTGYVLSNVLNPSDEIQDAYKMVVVTTRDGRTYSGNVISENDRQITMRVVGAEAVVINKSDIQSRETTDVSMMPPGLFDQMTEEEVLNLVAYLRSTGPV